MEFSLERLEQAESICEILEDYKPNPQGCVGNMCQLIHKSDDGRMLTIRPDGKMYSVHSSYPSHYYPDVKISIKVSINRGIDALANDIKKRLLPTYDEHYAIVLAKSKQDKQREQERKKLRDHIVCDIFEDTISSHQRDSGEIACYNYGMRRVNVSSDKVQLETTYLPKDIAIKIAEFIKTVAPKRVH